MQKYVKHVALYGASREIFEGAWKDKLSLSYNEKMADAILCAKEIAESGDAILLAPATSSFDQYKDYIARGNDFKNTVLNLK